jgi:glycosyltransferase involved in cell wall biosynthesis
MRLGGTSFMVYSPRWGSAYLTIAFKYLSQTIGTLRILFRQRPRVVFVMTPPVIACLPVWLYSMLTGASYVIDAHSAAFLDRRWRAILFLHRFFSRYAATTTVTNEHLRAVVRGWGASSHIVTDVPVCFAEPEPVTLVGRCNMTMVSSFTADEPLETFLAAARDVPDVQFYVTGSYRHADRRVLAMAPSNVTFTGFLSDARYVGQLVASDAVICLTTLNHTMQRGAYEAVYLSRPVITSNTPLLREAFKTGTVHVNNSVEDVARGIRQMRDNLVTYRDQVQHLRREKLQRWECTADDLRQHLSLL